MPYEDSKTPAGNFFTRLGRRVRSRSPTVSRLPSETPRKFHGHCILANAAGDRELDCVDPSRTPHLIGTLINKLSRRKSKKSEKFEGFTPECRNHTLPQGDGHSQLLNFGTPRPAKSENDIHRVTVCGKVKIEIFSNKEHVNMPRHAFPIVNPEISTPNGLSQFVSEHNLSTVENTLAYRAPSYIRVSCALSGYTRSPRYLEDSVVNSMGRSLVERRLGMFETTTNRNEGLNQFDELRRSGQTALAMGASFSAPSPVRTLIGHFDRLKLCSKDKDYAARNSGSTMLQASSEVAGKFVKCEPDVIDAKQESSVLPSVSLSPGTSEGKIHMRTGEDFAHLLESVKSRLLASVAQVLAELEQVESLPEEAGSSIRIAAGKAQLLVQKKLSKFEELLNKHLNPMEGDPHSTTIDDLEGYWALVEIELHDIDECFKEVDAWRESGWQVEEATQTQTFAVNTNNNNVLKKKIVSLRSGTVSDGAQSSVSAKQAEKQKAVAAMRKKAIAEAKQKMREAQLVQERAMNSSTSCDVLMIF